MKKIKIAIVGVGNCASSLIQGLEFYRRARLQNGQRDVPGLMNYEIGSYRPQDIEVVCAFDIDERKVGLPVKRAIFQAPNCTRLITN
ncbi:MAG: inositol-3-phosphate synthase, partial [Candidatus Omnitrophica bacterium CG07_land_8_20_14_0_80_50_8]